MWRVAQAFKPVLSSSSPAFKEDNTGLKACTTKFQFLCGLQRFVGSKVGQPILAAAGFSAGFPGPVGCLKEPAEKPAAGKIACPTQPVQLFAAKPRCATKDSGSVCEDERL